MTDVTGATRMDPRRIRWAWEGRISGGLPGKPRVVPAFRRRLAELILDAPQ
ncbi:MAG: hypothetical protein OEY13_04525 [Gammaproteobacteria bacterium]|nr:hypothetical protein [Gammaproteobacteria bacterium]MDH4256352.1 hypothetical protein [Gammaproteobacteria bacterium]MDH5272323.1 hypothetical protein [Gammaproteobacteria bacterium]